MPAHESDRLHTVGFARYPLAGGDKLVAAGIRVVAGGGDRLCRVLVAVVEL